MLIASLVGIPGSMVCIALGNRYGLMPPLLFGISCCVFGMSILLLEKTYMTYFLRMCLIGFGWSIALPYIQSLLASIDKKGSALAAGNSFATIGGAAGAALGASLIGQTGNYNMLLQVSLMIYIFAVVLILFSVIILALNTLVSIQGSLVYRHQLIKQNIILMIRNSQAVF